MSDLQTLPSDPCRLLGAWIEKAAAESGKPNPNAMMLATVGADGRPSVRTLLHKGYDEATGRLTFFTNYRSRKAREIENNPSVAIVIHWDKLERQVRLEGQVERAPADVSDAYFATRPREHQLGAWASEQSEPLESWEMLMFKVLQTADRFLDRDVERPPHWGGYVFTPDSIEFWQGGPGRVHERVLYTRDPDSEHGWTPQWLNP